MPVVTEHLTDRAVAFRMRPTTRVDLHSVSLQKGVAMAEEYTRRTGVVRARRSRGGEIVHTALGTVLTEPGQWIIDAADTGERTVLPERAFHEQFDPTQEVPRYDEKTERLIVESCLRVHAEQQVLADLARVESWDQAMSIGAALLDRLGPDE